MSVFAALYCCTMFAMGFASVAVAIVLHSEGRFLPEERFTFRTKRMIVSFCLIVGAYTVITIFAGSTSTGLAAGGKVGTCAIMAIITCFVLYEWHDQEKFIKNHPEYERK